jgi:Zinc finger, C3HC4 type (RING finger)
MHGLISDFAVPSSQRAVVPATTVKNQRTDVRTDVKTDRPSSSQSRSDSTVKHKNQSSTEREQEMESNKRRLLMTSFSQGSSDVGVKRIEKKPAAEEVSVRAVSSKSSAAPSSRVSSSTISSSNSSNSSSGSSSGSSSSRQGVLASKAIDQKSLFGYNYSDTLSQVDQAGADQPSQPSKRARMMLQAALQAPQPVVKRDLKGIIASINASKARNERGGSEKENCKEKQAEGAGKVSKKYVCTVCKNNAAEPCAAKCGHICCESCWSQWLRRSETCPCCRAPTLLQQIKKITIVKS